MNIYETPDTFHIHLKKLYHDFLTYLTVWAYDVWNFPISPPQLDIIDAVIEDSAVGLILFLIAVDWTSGWWRMFGGMKRFSPVLVFLCFLVGSSSSLYVGSTLSSLLKIASTVEVSIEFQSEVDACWFIKVSTLTFSICCNFSFLSFRICLRFAFSWVFYHFFLQKTSWESSYSLKTLYLHCTLQCLHYLSKEPVDLGYDILNTGNTWCIITNLHLLI